MDEDSFTLNSGDGKGQRRKEEDTCNHQCQHKRMRKGNLNDKSNDFRVLMVGWTGKKRNLYPDDGMTLRS
jgi:hypothetical protein